MKITVLKKKSNSMTSYVILFLLLLIFTACDQQSQASASKSKLTTSVAIKSSAKSTAGKPYSIDPALASEGKKLYLQNCVFCHQADAIGKPGVAPSLTNKEFLSIARTDFLFKTINNGRAGTGMPPFKHLGKKKIGAIIAFLRDHATLPSRIKEVNAQPVNQGDARIGKLFFNNICATCHGPKGDGYHAGGTGTAIGKLGFLNVVTDGFIRTTIKEGRSNTRMLSFQGPASLADLTNKEIDDIIAYLRTAPSEKK